MTKEHENKEIIHRFLQVEKDAFEGMVGQLLMQYATVFLPVRLVFFGTSTDNKEYLAQLACIREIVQKYFGDEQPLISYVAQPTASQGLAMEIHEVELTAQDKVSYLNYQHIPYIIIEREGCKRLFLSGVMGDVVHQRIGEQADYIFTRIGELLQTEQMPLQNIVRQWNYIEKITAYDEVGHQHYQDFNDARSSFYQQVEWTTGYPAATGIGTQWGGVMIDMDALLCKDNTVQVSKVDNSLQVAAHAYSKQLLLGETLTEHKTTPKFERAKAIWKHDHGFVYISGTAAIRGEQSLQGVGIKEQTRITMENIEHLVSAGNLQQSGVPVTQNAELINFRVYVKHRKDMEQAREVVQTRYPDLPAIYTLTDVCRSELLVEIEGMGLLR